VNTFTQTGRGRPASEHRVLTYTEVDGVEGDPRRLYGHPDQKAQLHHRGQVHGLYTCVEYCPVEYPDRFNQDISNNKAVHIYFAQAIPLIAYIDESCLYLKEKKCRICEGVCKNDAIDLHQAPEKIDVNVAAIVLAPGYECLTQGKRRLRLRNAAERGDQYGLRTADVRHRAIRRRDTARFGQKASPQHRLDSMRRFQAGHRGRQQLLLGNLLHLHPETGDFDQGS
jgi:NAD-dependent dihydropyrimidine dehydrogenase PreA subunit